MRILYASIIPCFAPDVSSAVTQMWRLFYAQNQIGKEVCPMAKLQAIRTPSQEKVGIQEFLDMISPSVIKFNTDHFICGNTFRCVWALREHPTW